MTRPHGLLRAGYPYLKTLGMRRITNFPTDIAFGKDDTAYILCRTEGVALIRIWPLDDMAEQTDNLKQIGSYGSGDGQFVWPVQLIANAEGDLFVSDEATHRITRFSPEGDFIAKWGIAGEADGEFDGPTGIAFDPDGNLVVVDSKNHRVQTYTPEGKYLGGFGAHGAEPGQFDLPWGVHVDELGDIYVADWGNHRLQIFSSDGEVKNVVGSKGVDEGEFDRPTGIAVDAHGDIYVADWGNNRVQMFNAEGHYLWSFRGNATLSRVARTYMLTNAVPNRLREEGRLEQEQYLRRPRSVRIDDAFRLFIADYESYRIQVYQKDVIELDETQFAASLRNPTLEVT
jgi:DNA-binding beta-propeller fold protein YncE